VGCKDYDDDIDQLQAEIDANKASIDDILAKIKNGQYVQKVETVSDGIKVTLGDGTVATIKHGMNGQDGAAGQNGAAATIEISEDGFWVINGTKTDTPARGEKGDKGDKGDQGEKGEPGAAGNVATVQGPKIVDGELQLYNAETGKYEGTGIRTGAAVATQEGGWSLAVTDENGNATSVFLPKTLSYDLSVVYRQKTAYDGSLRRDYFNYILDEDNKSAVLASKPAEFEFKLYGNNLESFCDKLEYFFDIYNLSKAADPIVKIVGTECEKDASGAFHLLTVKAIAENTINTSYRASLNAACEVDGKKVESASEYNVQFYKRNLYKRDLKVNEETKQGLAAYTQLQAGRNFQFVYTDQLVLTDTIFLMYNQSNIDWDGVMVEYAVVDKNNSAKYFSLEGANAKGEVAVAAKDGKVVVKAGNAENAQIAAINHQCGLTVRYYVLNAEGKRVYLTEAIAFTVEAVRPGEIKVEKEALPLYNKADGTTQFRMVWSNVTTATADIDLYSADHSLYAQFDGRDKFIDGYTNGGSATTYYLYAYDKTAKVWNKVDGVTLSWTPGNLSPTGDQFTVNVATGTYVAQGVYTVSAQDLTNAVDQPTFVAGKEVRATIDLEVDLNATVLHNEYYVDGTNTFYTRGEFDETAKTHAMTDNMGDKFWTSKDAKALALEYIILPAKDQDAKIKALMDKGALTVTTDGEINLTEAVDVETLPAVKVQIVPTGYTGKKTLTNGMAYIKFLNPLDKNSLTLKAIANVKETAAAVTFDFADVVTGLKDKFNHVIISTDKKGVTTQDDDWMTAYDVEISKDVTTYTIDGVAANKSEIGGKFSWNGEVLTYNGAATQLTKDVEVKVPVTINSKWGAFKETVTVKVLRDAEK